MYSRKGLSFHEFHNGGSANGADTFKGLATVLDGGDFTVLDFNILFALHASSFTFAGHFVATLT
ncbi:hypothetical protein D5b_00170 [Faustovirus]|nr:hypothetical protein D5b_00170 [Faustovirus]AMN84742.1 hypothetical protein D6_00341 [Faustovirus]AMP44126.1 hypothetical protein PRJ_Dakar_00168 [Faustovirus]